MESTGYSLFINSRLEAKNKKVPGYKNMWSFPHNCISPTDRGVEMVMNRNEVSTANGVLICVWGWRPAVKHMQNRSCLKRSPWTGRERDRGYRVISTKFKHLWILWDDNFQRVMLTWLTEIVTWLLIISLPARNIKILFTNMGFRDGVPLLNVRERTDNSCVYDTGNDGWDVHNRK